MNSIDYSAVRCSSPSAKILAAEGIHPVVNFTRTISLGRSPKIKIFRGKVAI
ncbi:hypothetical protein [Microcoleus sp. A2-C2]|uniref:hypothetical protein n=1 Tax=Microcoleus sp. A2-C2 TaxID=2818530 RepID=UPI002FD4D281